MISFFLISNITSMSKVIIFSHLFQNHTLHTLCMIFGYQKKSFFLIKRSEVYEVYEVYGVLKLFYKFYFLL